MRSPAMMRSGVAWILAACVGQSSAEESSRPSFATTSVEVGAAPRQTLVPGFFLGGRLAQLAVIQRKESGPAWLRLFASCRATESSRQEGAGFELQPVKQLGEGTWLPVVELSLPEDARFVDVCRIAGRDHLLVYRDDGVHRLDLPGGSLHPLVAVTTHYRAASPEEARMAAGVQCDVPRIDITRDLNEDGREDIVLPDRDGFWICLQAASGGFPGPTKLGPAEPFLDRIARVDRPRRYRDMGLSVLTIPWYLSRVHTLDQDGDGRVDLAFWSGDHFEVYHQGPAGGFSPQATAFTTEVPFDADGVYSLAFGLAGESTFSLLLGLRRKGRRSALHSVRDLNGDGVADLVVQYLEGRSLLRQRSRYLVHYGALTPQGITFPRLPSTRIEPRGRAGGLQLAGYASQLFEDFDGDGQVDVLFRDVSVGIGGMTRAMLGRSVAIDLELYRMEDGVYPGEPSATREVRRFALFDPAGSVFFAPVLMADVTGDGRSDLVVGEGPAELLVYPGVAGPQLLAAEPRRLAVRLPADERNTWRVDLDGGGAAELLMHQAPGIQPRVMLVAQPPVGETAGR